MTQNVRDIKDILFDLRAIQLKADYNLYSQGIFPSIRYHSTLPYKREDENIFFSAAVAFTLREYRHYLDEESKEVVDEIACDVVKNYKLFQNPKGLSIYNFFKTKPRYLHFPNGLFLCKFKAFKLAEDSDDTAYVYLTQPYTSEQALWLKDKFKLHANTSRGKQIKHTFRQFRDSKIYSVYFGEKMFIEYDICVFTNILLFNHSYNLSINEYDKHTIQYICTSVKENLHISHPHIIAPYYPTFAQIVYHISRLISVTQMPELKAIASQLSQDIIKQIHTADKAMDKLMMIIALYRLEYNQVGEIDSALKLNQQLIEKASFFYVNPLLKTSSFYLRKLLKYRLVHCFNLRTHSKGYNLALFFEYKMRQLIYKKQTVSTVKT